MGNHMHRREFLNQAGLGMAALRLGYAVGAATAEEPPAVEADLPSYFTEEELGFVAAREWLHRYDAVFRSQVVGTVQTVYRAIKKTGVWNTHTSSDSYDGPYALDPDARRLDILTNLVLFNRALINIRPTVVHAIEPSKHVRRGECGQPLIRVVGGRALTKSTAIPALRDVNLVDLGLADSAGQRRAIPATAFVMSAKNLWCELCRAGIISAAIAYNSLVGELHTIFTDEAGNPRIVTFEELFAVRLTLSAGSSRHTYNSSTIRPYNKQPDQC